VNGRFFLSGAKTFMVKALLAKWLGLKLLEEKPLVDCAGEFFRHVIFFLQRKETQALGVQWK